MSRLVTLAEFHLRSMWNWRTLYYGRLIEPLVFFGLLTAGLSGAAGSIKVEDESLSYVRFVFPGMLALVCLRAGATVMVDVANDRKWGVFALSSLNGTSRSTYVLSVCLATAAIACTQAVLLYVMLLLLPGGEVHVSDLAVLPVFAAVLAAWLCLGIAAGMRVNSYHRRDLILSLALLPTAFTAPLFYSFDVAPAYLRWIGAVNPLTYHAELMRQTLTGQPPLALILIVLAILTATILGAGLFTRQAQLLSQEAG